MTILSLEWPSVTFGPQAGVGAWRQCPGGADSDHGPPGTARPGWPVQGGSRPLQLPQHLPPGGPQRGLGPGNRWTSVGGTEDHRWGCSVFYWLESSGCWAVNICTYYPEICKYPANPTVWPQREQKTFSVFHLSVFKRRCSMNTPCGCLCASMNVCMRFNSNISLFDIFTVYGHYFWSHDKGAFIVCKHVTPFWLLDVEGLIRDIRPGWTSRLLHDFCCHPF